MKITEKINRWWRQLRGKSLDEHEQQLMRLYWNRAELKKELSGLQDEKQVLLAKLDAHQTAVKRTGEQVDELSAYLGRPEVAEQALLYFQLRSLWHGCSGKLTKFVADLRSQQEDRERVRHRAECEAIRATQLAELERRLLNAQSIVDSLKARLKLFERKLAGMKWFWYYWKRRDLKVEMAQVRAQWEVASVNATDLADERAAIAGAALDEYPGLSLEGRRIVNTAAIAYAEWLITMLPQRHLAPLARQAISVQIFDAHLGTPQECARNMEVVRAALSELAGVDQQLASLREPTEQVRSRARYRSAQDTVPLSDSVGDVSLHAAGDGNSSKINVLTEDYWSLTQVLIH